MIRINLLPVRQVRKVQAVRRQLSIFAALLAVQLVIMFWLHQQKADQIEDRQRVITGLQGEVDQLKSQVGDFDKLKEQHDRLLSQRNVINSLHSGRTGPVAMLRELSDILSPGKGPTIKQEDYEELIRRDPSAGYNPRWNPRRVWIERLDERNRQVAIVGKAKDHDDVAELLRRLSLSRLFSDVQLQRNQLDKDDSVGIKVVRFTLSCKVNY